MQKKLAGVLALLGTLAVQLAGAAPFEFALSKPYDALLGGTADAAKQKLTCTGAWMQSNGHSPDGKRNYLTYRCPVNEGQVYVTEGKVFAIGVRLQSGMDARAASTTYKEIKQDLTKASCKLTDRGQVVVARCPDSKAIAVLHNWDSKTNTDSLSMLYGQSELLLPMMGIPITDK